jgi:hypothetical protein
LLHSKKTWTRVNHLNWLCIRTIDWLKIFHEMILKTWSYTNEELSQRLSSLKEIFNRQDRAQKFLKSRVFRCLASSSVVQFFQPFDLCEMNKWIKWRGQGEILPERVSDEMNVVNAVTLSQKQQKQLSELLSNL